MFRLNVCVLLCALITGCSNEMPDKAETILDLDKQQFVALTQLTEQIRVDAFVMATNEIKEKRASLDKRIARGIREIADTYDDEARTFLPADQWSGYLEYKDQLCDDIYNTLRRHIPTGSNREGFSDDESTLHSREAREAPPGG